MVRKLTPPSTDRREQDEQLIARLYRQGTAIPPERFRIWALEQVRQAIAFDCAYWGGGYAPEWKFRSVTLVNLPPEFPGQLEATSRINPVSRLLLKNLNVPQRMQDACPDEVFFKSEIYRTVFRPEGISRVMSTLSHNAQSGIYSILALYRKQRAHLFTDAEKIRQQRIVFHLLQAESQIYFLNLWLRSKTGPLSSANAVVDRQLYFHHVQPDFLVLVEKYLGKPAASTLPFALPPAGVTVRIGDLCARSEPLGDQWCVQIWPAGPLDKLTARERSVAESIAQGLSFKETAQLLGLAPSTVANHLYRIYRKLSINGRTELAKLVHPG